MPAVLRVVGLVFVGVLLVLVAAAVAIYSMSETKLNQTLGVPTETVAIPTDTSAIQRGQHLAAAVGVCIDCHGTNLAGKVFIDDPALGRVVSSNLTRGRGAVGATYSDADFVRSIRHGVSQTITTTSAMLISERSSRTFDRCRRSTARCRAMSCACWVGSCLRRTSCRCSRPSTSITAAHGRPRLRSE